MQSSRPHNRWIIALSFLVAYILSVFPLPMDWRWLRPEFVALLVIYWVVMMPQHLGVGMAWCAGLVQDIIEGAALGEHALALVVVAYVCQISYQRVLNYVIWQQAGLVFVLIGIHQLFCNWVHGLVGYSAPPQVFLVPALISAMLWPLVVPLFDHFRTHFGVT
jgi:rod shape-determining protein MreD